MKVRLKLNPYNAASSGQMFQFHEGPIKTFVGSVASLFVTAFQFHEGPIKTKEPLHLLWSGEPVSIP